MYGGLAGSPNDMVISGHTGAFTDHLEQGLTLLVLSTCKVRCLLKWTQAGQSDHELARSEVITGEHLAVASNSGRGYVQE